MTREIIAVYQDCVLCGVKGRQKIAEYADEGISIRKVSFISEEGRNLCAEAVNKGIGSMPFYVAGDNFATSIEALITKKTVDKPKMMQKSAVKTSKSTSRKQKVAKEARNGDNTEI